MASSFPISFLEVLVDIADTAGVKSAALADLRKQLEAPKNDDSFLKELIPVLIWDIENAGGEFIGPHIAG